MSGLSDELVAALRELAATRRLLVALDFDGTLAPEVDSPERARATPEARAAVLRLLGAPDTRVALVSGRAIRSLEEVAELPGDALLVGSHGIEVRLDTPDPTVDLDPDEVRQVELLGQVLGAVADSLDQVWLEPKPAGFALHTRTATEEDTRAAHVRARRDVAEQLGELMTRSGKNVLEFSVRSTTKGDAVDRLREHTGATATMFAGDDVTDEDGFAALLPQDLGLKSGEGATAARYRVAGPAEVADVLTLLADLRGARER